MAEEITREISQNLSQVPGNTIASSADAIHVNVPVDNPSLDHNTLWESYDNNGDFVATATNDKCYLLEMTSEIRQKIWCYTIQEQKAVQPRQILAHSNKFVPSLVKYTLKPGEVFVKGKVYPEPMPMAAQMSLVCHQLYDEITGSSLFYRINEFEFNEFPEMLAYLVAITPNRANSIRSVIINTPTWGKDNTAMHAFHMLANNEGLRNLKIKILLDYSWTYFLHFDELIPGRNGLKSVRGLDTFDLQCGLLSENPNWSHLTFKVELDVAYKRLTALRQEITADVFRPRVAVPLRKIKDAQEASGLNIYGEGRLGPDRKPGIVSSRTRAQLLKQQGFNDAGVCAEEREVPKFGEFGDLLWDIQSITNSRELAGDAGKRRIEVLVTWVNNPAKSWELLDNVVGSLNVYRVARHYMRNPDAYDVPIAMATIKELVEKCPEKTSVLNDLSVLMRREESLEADSRFQRLSRSVRYRPY